MFWGGRSFTATAGPLADTVDAPKGIKELIKKHLTGGKGGTEEGKDDDARDMRGNSLGENIMAGIDSLGFGGKKKL